MPAALPMFSRGLRLVRLGVFVMLLQLALTILVTVKTLYVDSPESARDAFKWMQYLLLANAAATFGMLIGAARAIPELRRATIETRGLVIGVVGFAIATAALAWTYHALASFVDVVFDPSSTLEDLTTATDRLSSLKTIVIVKDFAYAVGLISLIRMVQRSAAANDQLGLRDEAGSTSRALMVMLVADLFWQLTYGLGGSVGVMGLVGSLLVGIYWIYCHIRLARFLYNAAWFMNEPHDLPVAMVVKIEKPVAKPARPSQPAMRPSQPAQPLAAPQPPPPPIIAPPPPPPRPTTTSATAELDPDGPRFLR
ncbi:MAG TPA: hypothetical protein VFQ65_12775 [Kofleriaceae bacterium]|nr:hypothetical protein [Kofleriaceae bacterium]